MTQNRGGGNNRERRCSGKAEPYSRVNRDKALSQIKNQANHSEPPAAAHKNVSRAGVAVGVLLADVHPSEPERNPSAEHNAAEEKASHGKSNRDKGY